MRKKQCRKRKKNQQVQRLNKSIKKNNEVLENTTVQGTVSLSGSDESGGSFDGYNNNNEKINGKPLKYIVADYVKEKGIVPIIVGVISSIIIPVAGWSLLKTIEMDKNLAEQEIRLKRLEKDIEEFTEKTPNKELIEYELNNLKAISKDINEFDKRLTKLEHLVIESK